MTTGAFLFGGIIVGVLIYLAILPIMSARSSTKEKELNKLNVQELRTRYLLLLTSVRDLDFDYDMNKISYEVYAEQRKMLIGRSVSLLMQLDRAEAQLATVDGEIEQAIEAARQQKHSNNGHDEDLESQIAAQRQGIQT